MKKKTFIQTVVCAVLFSVLLFVGCEQATLSPVSGEAASYSLAAKAAPNVTVAPTTWSAFTPLPFSGMANITSVSGLATDSAYLVATAFDGTADIPYTSRYDVTTNIWSKPVSLVPYGVTIKPGAVHYLHGWYLVTGASTSTNGAFSPDGTNWKQTGTIGFGTKAAVYGPAERLYVVAGQNGQAAYTPNLGDNFVTIPETVTGWSGTGNTAYINAGAYGSGRYVFGGGSGRIAYTDSILKSSEDNPWVGVEDSPLKSADFVNAIAYGGDDTFVAVGNTLDGGVIVYSTDRGETWEVADTTDSPDVLENGIYALTYDNGYYVAVNDSGDVAYSANGITWTDATGSVSYSAGVNVVVFYPADNAFFAAGSNAGGVQITVSR
jgi:hypothetical protein